MRKIFALAALSAALAGLRALYPASLAADNVNSTPSGEQSGTIGCWYDKLWAVTAAYRLTPSAAGASFVYARVAGVPAVDKADVDKYKSGDVGVPVDFVITEWYSTGHMHFTSSGGGI
ncbi:MAG: hypothetical protein WC421_04905 [Elusimicrobiales bacterium]